MGRQSKHSIDCPSLTGEFELRLRGSASLSETSRRLRDRASLTPHNNKFSNRTKWKLFVARVLCQCTLECQLWDASVSYFGCSSSYQTATSGHPSRLHMTELRTQDIASEILFSSCSVTSATVPCVSLAVIELGLV